MRRRSFHCTTVVKVDNFVVLGFSYGGEHIGDVFAVLVEFIGTVGIHELHSLSIELPGDDPVPMRGDGFRRLTRFSDDFQVAKLLGYLGVTNGGVDCGVELVEIDIFIGENGIPDLRGNSGYKPSRRDELPHLGYVSHIILFVCRGEFEQRGKGASTIGGLA